MLNAELVGDNNISQVKINKVEQHFAHSAGTYSQGAQLQNIVAEQLLSKIADKSNKLALDLGCGPGLFTKALTKKVESLVSLDLSWQMLRQIQQTTNKVQANSHNLPFQDDSFDLVFSSLMIQWCDFEQVIEQVYSVLKPGGAAYISTLITGSLYELQQAWSAVDDDNHIHQYQSIEQLLSVVNKGNWQSVEIEQQTQTLWFDQVRSLAQELKLLGANYVQSRKNKGLMTKSKWQKMEQAYRDKFFCLKKQAFPASYQVVLLELRK